eukprot:Rmarinus@m.8474
MEWPCFPLPHNLRRHIRLHAISGAPRFRCLRVGRPYGGYRRRAAAPENGSEVDVLSAVLREAVGAACPQRQLCEPRPSRIMATLPSPLVFLRLVGSRSCVRRHVGGPRELDC